MDSFLKKYKFWIIVACVVVFSLLFDLITKSLFYEKYYTFIDGVINIWYTFNTGAAWSILANQTILLIILSLLILVGLTLFAIFYKSSSTLYSIAVGLIYGGAIGNLIDRIFLGGVRDFIRLEFWPSFPIFNIADCCLTIGAILLCVYFLFFFSILNKKSSVANEGKIDKKEDKNFFEQEKNVLHNQNVENVNIEIINENKNLKKEDTIKKQSTKNNSLKLKKKNKK